MGHGDPDLQLALFAKYLSLLQGNGDLPGAICFDTEGGQLVVDRSPVLDDLQAIERAGARLIVCHPCLAHYGLTERLRAGIVGGLADILAAQAKAAAVVSI